LEQLSQADNVKALKNKCIGLKGLCMALQVKGLASKVYVKALQVEALASTVPLLASNTGVSHDEHLGIYIL